MTDGYRAADDRKGRDDSIMTQARRHKANGIGGMTGRVLATAAALAVAGALAISPLPATAQSPIDTSGHDADQPIEITAQESLEWSENDQVATFRGDVKAMQGELTLEADVLKVFVRQGRTGTDSSGGNGQREISRIEADGHVRLSTPRETATGDKGVYDVDRGEMTLSGGVQLTQGDNRLDGARLVLNLESGRTVLESGDSPVRGLFIPRKK